MLPMAPGGQAQGRTSESGGLQRSKPQRGPDGSAPAFLPDQRGAGPATGGGAAASGAVAGAAGSPHAPHTKGAAHPAQGGAGQGPGGAAKRPVALSLAALEVSMGCQRIKPAAYTLVHQATSRTH